jgi:hypothetical protein
MAVHIVRVHCNSSICHVLEHCGQAQNRGCSPKYCKAFLLVPDSSMRLLQVPVCVKREQKRIRYSYIAERQCCTMPTTEAIPRHDPVLLAA